MVNDFIDRSALKLFQSNIEHKSMIRTLTCFTHQKPDFTLTLAAHGLFDLDAVIVYHFVHQVFLF